MGIVEQALSKWRKQEMKLDLTPSQVQFIVISVLNPYQFPINSYGIKPYSPQGKEWKKLSSLRKWVTQNLIIEPNYKRGELVSWKTRDENVAVGIKDGTGKDVLIEVLKHYEVIGVLTEWVDSYGPLMNTLKGENVAIDDFNDEIKENELEKEKEKKKEEKS